MTYVKCPLSGKWVPRAASVSTPRMGRLGQPAEPDGAEGGSPRSRHNARASSQPAGNRRAPAAAAPPSAARGSSGIRTAPSLLPSPEKPSLVHPEEGPHPAMPGACWVLDRFLAVGSSDSAGCSGPAPEEKCRLLLQHGITHVVNCGEEFGCPFREDFEYLHLMAKDEASQNMISYWPAACDFIDEAFQQGGRVLLHCASGASRSGSTAVAFLMRHFKITLQDALEVALERRPSILPNPGFHEQLEVFERLSYKAPDVGAGEEAMFESAGEHQRFPRLGRKGPTPRPASTALATPAGSAPLPPPLPQKKAGRPLTHGQQKALFTMLGCLQLAWRVWRNMVVGEREKRRVFAEIAALTAPASAPTQPLPEARCVAAAPCAPAATQPLPRQPELEQLRGQVRELRDELLVTKTELETLYGDRHAQQQQLREELAAARAEAAAAQARAQAEQPLGSAKTDEMAAKIHAAAAALEALKSEQSLCKEDLLRAEDLEGRLAQREGELKDLREEVQRLRAEKEEQEAASRKGVEGLREELRSREAECHAARAQGESHQELGQLVAQELPRLRTELEETQGELQKVQARLQIKDAMLEDLTQERDALLAAKGKADAAAPSTPKRPQSAPALAAEENLDATVPAVGTPTGLHDGLSQTHLDRMCISCPSSPVSPPASGRYANKKPVASPDPEAPQAAKSAPVVPGSPQGCEEVMAVPTVELPSPARDERLRIMEAASPSASRRSPLPSLMLSPQVKQGNFSPVGGQQVACGKGDPRAFEARLGGAKTCGPAQTCGPLGGSSQAWGGSAAMQRCNSEGNVGQAMAKLCSLTNKLQRPAPQAAQPQAPAAAHGERPPRDPSAPFVGSPAPLVLSPVLRAASSPVSPARARSLKSPKKVARSPSRAMSSPSRRIAMEVTVVGGPPLTGRSQIAT